MNNPFTTWRLRTWLFLGLAVIALACLTLFLLLRASRSTRTEYPDYSAALQYYPNGVLLSQPSAKELARFPTLWPTRPPEQNAATFYLKAASFMSKATPPAGSAASQAAYAGDLAALENWVAANRPALEALLAANKLDYCRYPFFGKTQFGAWDIAGSQVLSDIRQLARTSRDAAIVEELKGNPDAAADWYLACIRMGAQVRRGTLIQMLVGIALCSIGQNGLESLMANRALSTESLKKTIERCRAAESSVAELADMVECEREASKDMMRSQGVGGRVGYYLLGMRKGLNKAQKDAATPLFTLLADSDAQAVLRGTKARFTGILEPAYLRWRVELGRMDVRLRVTQTRAAIALYQRETGKFPDALNALCPKFLPFVPLDPFSGKPLRYERTGDGWKLWSVGDDLKDDGGTAKSAKSWSDGPDYVFTSHARTNLDRITQAK